MDNLQQYNAPTDKHNIAANCAIFLKTHGLSIFDRWKGRLPASMQRILFGTYLGKGTILIDGERDTVSHTVTVCFGLDWDTQTLTVADLAVNPGRCPHHGPIVRAPAGS